MILDRQNKQTNHSKGQPQDKPSQGHMKNSFKQDQDRYAKYEAAKQYQDKYNMNRDRIEFL